MGLSRNVQYILIKKVSFSSYISKEQCAVPSPSKYINEKPRRTNSPKYTLRPKTTVIDKTKTI